MSATLLVIEDDPEMREVLVESLEDQGYCAQGAASADEAIELSRKFQFDLVISDVRMAGSRDGIGALEVLKRQRPTLKTVVITGFTSPEAPGRAVKLAVDDYVYKPFRLPDMLATVRRVLNPRRAGYLDMLSKIWSAPQKWREQKQEKELEQAANTVQAEREECYQGYYVSIRSRHLSKIAALEVWDELEKLDALQLPPTQLVGRYRQLHELAAGMAKNRKMGSLKDRDAGRLDKAVFSRFYDRIQEGQLTPEHVKLAASLRRLNDSTDKTTREMAGFVWGA